MQNRKMKIHPPKVEIDKTQPYRGALFGREEFGRSLLQLLREAEEGLVLFINAPWGQGKTTFARMFVEHVRSEKLDAIYFDAYEADSSDPFIAFSAEILAFARFQLGAADGKASRNKFKTAAVDVGKRLAGAAIRIGVRAATMGAVDASELENLKATLEEAGKETGDIISKEVEKRIDGYLAEKESFASFKKSLAELAALYRNSHGFPLTVIVDELDRCRPSYALALLERIKHLFDVEGVAFILLLNQAQIESYVRTIYGENVDARSYLLKFATVFVDLPGEPRSGETQRGYGKFFAGLLEHHAFPAEYGKVLQQSMASLSYHFQLSLRDVEKASTILAIYFASLPRGQFTDAFAVSMLSILKLKRPDLFGKIAQGTVTFAEFVDETKLHQLQKESPYQISQSWVKDFLEFCLMSEDEWGSAQNAPGGPFDSWFGRFDLPRRKALPFLCGRLTQFSVADNLE